jgi:hypothetical protein
LVDEEVTVAMTAVLVDVLLDEGVKSFLNA